jgi:hypothetical protein
MRAGHVIRMTGVPPQLLLSIRSRYSPHGLKSLASLSHLTRQAHDTKASATKPLHLASRALLGHNPAWPMGPSARARLLHQDRFALIQSVRNLS